MKVCPPPQSPCYENPYYAVCTKCPYFIEKDDWPEGEEALIHYICYAVNPAPCQAKCIYCSQRLAKRRAYDKSLDSAKHELVFKTIEYFRKKKRLAPDIFWDIGSGEITVHPYRYEVYKMVGNDKTQWLTNCFIFDEHIGSNLKSNRDSSLRFSIDAGTPEAWYKIKGVDNFSKILDNLTKYYQTAAHSGQIVLKYLLLPGVNDNIDDFVSFVEIAKRINASIVILSRDRWADKSANHVEKAGLLLSLLRRSVG